MDRVIQMNNCKLSESPALMARTVGKMRLRGTKGLRVEGRNGVPRSEPTNGGGGRGGGGRGGNQQRNNNNQQRNNNNQGQMQQRQPSQLNWQQQQKRKRLVLVSCCKMTSASYKCRHLYHF